MKRPVFSSSSNANVLSERRQSIISASISGSSSSKRRKFTAMIVLLLAALGVISLIASFFEKIAGSTNLREASSMEIEVRPVGIPKIQEPRKLEEKKKKKRTKMVLLPILGLGNRLRTLQDFHAIISCPKVENWLQSHNTEFKEMYWPSTDDLNADYHSLFSQPTFQQLSEQDMNDILKNKRYILLTHNSISVSLYNLSSWFGHFLGSTDDIAARTDKTNMMFKLSMSKLLKQYISDVKLDYILLASAWGLRMFGSREQKCDFVQEEGCRRQFLQDLWLSPQAEAQTRKFRAWKQAVKVSTGGKASILGLHMRLKDMMTHLDYGADTASAELSSQVLKKVMDSHPENVLFIATDQVTSIEPFRAALGNRVFINDFDETEGDPRDRSFEQGIMNGIADLFCLGETDEVWANAMKSTYANWAAQMTKQGRPKFVLEYLKSIDI